MKKKRIVQKVSMVIGVCAMSFGLFTSFDAKADKNPDPDPDPAGVCCQQLDVECYNYTYHVLVPDSYWLRYSNICY